MINILKKYKKKAILIIGLLIVIISVVFIAVGSYRIALYMFGGSLLGASAYMNKLGNKKNEIEMEYKKNEEDIKNYNYNDTSSELDKLIFKRRASHTKKCK